MPAPPSPHTISAGTFAVPPPFRHLAVRSDEAAHAWQARSPYGRVHLLRPPRLAGTALAGLAAQGWPRVLAGGALDAALDVTHASTTPADLAAAVPPCTMAAGASGLAGQIALALQPSGVLGADAARYHQATAGRIDYLGCRGAGFHNDVSGHWSRCLFWVLALDLAEVDFVQAHVQLGGHRLRLPLAPGDLLVFDPSLAHGLCRQGDGGQALAASFETGRHDRQLFLTGELLLSDADWAALGTPWLPVEDHAALDALDLLVASFDASSGHIQRLHTLRGGMQRSVCHADLPG